ncbi:MAG TPA: hypothetical protein VG222_17805 [Vicinamibacterales bacterium]|nr:hypothetical protein [Vicinamibacterales bacterium]
MPRSRERSSVVRLPRPVARWLGAMSTRIGAPRHRVLRALLDGYAEHLPDVLRRRVDEQMRLRRERQRPQ